MALIFHEGFDTAPQVSPPWSHNFVAPGRVTPGRNGSHAMKTGWYFDGDYSTFLDLGQNLTTVVSGAGFYVVDSSLSTHEPIMTYRDGSTVHLRVYLNSNGSFEVRRGDDTLLGSSSAGLVQAQ